MLRRLLKVILARKRDASGWRAEARRWERLYHAERAHSKDLLDKVLQKAGMGTIQDRPAQVSVHREPRLEEMTDAEFERAMEAEDIAHWAARAEYDPTARTYLEGIAGANPTAAVALSKLRFTPTE